MTRELRELEASTREAVRERYEEVAKDDREGWLDQPHDDLFEIVDGLVPDYTYDLMQLAAEDIELATAEPELGPAFDGSPTPVNIIAANVFEQIQEWAFDEIRNLQSELEDEEDEEE